MGRFSFESKPKVENIVLEKGDVRVSLLTSELLRVEKGNWTDMATQSVWNRALGKVDYTLEENDQGCVIATDEVTFVVDAQAGKVTSVILFDGTVVKNFQKGNLLGTARTLDNVNGAIKLEQGILSMDGASVMDDSKSLLLDQDGNILERPKCSDKYYFAYGHDYRRQLKDFFRMTGEVPLIPKYALGNWWSRYKAYTQEEYRSLMKEFIRREIPITVATIDMDWHWVDVVQKFGPKAKSQKPKHLEEILYNLVLHGWTGYTWNTELFPDYKELLRWLHEKNFHVTLNVHPSQGIRFFENCYEAICKRVGQDPKTQEYVPFDITNKDFVEAYFDEAHHPYEEDGVDFWWLDWQQGKHTRIPGLDPLWALNHYHTLDNARGETRPLILSRYAGIGSHRYPLGFSGDTICTWESLDFQPYFTNNAANAGYTWWSHDIGGHMKGDQDDELYLRWLQYGVFSPINRLHSSNSDFMGKEPWKRSWAVEKISEKFLRLRHKLIPYLYSANYETHINGTPICMPMYYEYDCREAYEIKNQYIFGGQLLVAPITTPTDKRMNLAGVDVWLPEGRWTDIFNGHIYEGGRFISMYRDWDSIPVLAKEGAIVPMYLDDKTNDLSIEQPLEIHVWRGNGSYQLYEDDGETNAYVDGKYAITEFKVETKGDELTFTIHPAANASGVLPESRTMRICFRDIEVEPVEVTVASEPIKIHLEQIKCTQNQPFEESRIQLLTRVQAGNSWKSSAFKTGKKLPEFLQGPMEELMALRLTEN